MRLLSLDFDPVFGKGNTRSTFAHDASVFDYDAVIWDPQGSYQWYTQYASTYQGLPCLTDDGSVQIQADVKRRRSEFKEFVEAGRCLVVVVRGPQACYVATGTKSYSGTGRNQVETRHVTQFDLWSALPIDSPALKSARGDRIEIVGDGPFPKLLRDYKQWLSYTGTMSNPPGVVVARVAGTARIVSSVVEFAGGGKILLLPAVDFEPEYPEDAEEDDEEEWPEEASEFQAALLSVVHTLTGGKVVARPAWASRYATSAQQQLRADVTKQQASVERARAKLAASQQKAEAAEAPDQLYLGTGRALELEVKAVLEMLGGTVTEPEPGRDDWRVQFPERKAVVEVKGVAKSAAEKHAAQLEKWVAGAYESDGEIPKGILVVNTWREVELADRTGDDFPAQMIPYSSGRGHCLLTGLELFVIRAEIEADPAKAEFWRKKILETDGRLEGVPDWRTVMNEVAPDAASE